MALKSLLTKWNKRLDGLMQSNQGRRIASDAERLRLFAGLSQRMPTSNEQITDWEEQLRLLLRSVPEQPDEDDGTRRVPDESLHTLQEISRKVKVATAHLSRQSLALEATLFHRALKSPQNYRYKSMTHLN